MMQTIYKITDIVWAVVTAISLCFWLYDKIKKKEQ